MNRIGLENSQKTFRAIPDYEKTAGRFSQKPFGISFKGRILTSDVFEREQENKKEGFRERALRKGKLAASAVIGTTLSLRDRVREKTNEVISFAGRVRENTMSIWKKLSNIRIEDMFERQTNPYTNMTVPELEKEFRDNLSVA